MRGTRARRPQSGIGFALRLVRSGVPPEKAARRAQVSPEQLRRALGVGKKQLTEGEDDVTSEAGQGGKTVKLVDTDTKVPVDVPGGIERLRRSPAWRKGTDNVWRYLGARDEHGYPANDPWLARHRYEKRLSDYQERFNSLTGTQEGYQEAKRRAERDGISLSEAINTLANEAYPPKPQPGIRGGVAQPLTDALIRERADAFALSERDAINSLMLDGYRL